MLLVLLLLLLVLLLLLLLLLLVLLLLLLLLKLILELLFLHLLQDHKQVHCWAGGRGLAAGSWRSLRVVDRCCGPAAPSSAWSPLDGPAKGTRLGSPF